MGSTIRLDHIETEKGTPFPIQLVVCLCFSSSVGTQIDSKLKITRLLKSLLSSETGRLNPSFFQTRFREAYRRYLGKCVSLDPYISADVC